MVLSSQLEQQLLAAKVDRMMAKNPLETVRVKAQVRVSVTIMFLNL